MPAREPGVARHAAVRGAEPQVARLRRRDPPAQLLPDLAPEDGVDEVDADGNGTLDKAEAAALTRTIAESGTVDLETAERLMEQAMNPGGKAGMEQSAMDFDAFFEGYVRVSGKTLMHITAARSIELHTAIRDGRLDAVEELFASGAVHCSLPLYTDGEPSAQGVLPLHRAARHGHLDIVRFLLRQVHPKNRAALLDAPTCTTTRHCTGPACTARPRWRKS